MTTEEFSAQVGQVFQAEWQRARRQALALAFTLGMIMGLLFGTFHAELSQLLMCWCETATSRLLIGSSPFSLL